ncbi:MAG: MFS transporter [Clostridia bacterium]|nr:MFS transporter [Clostridia bacterium]
MISGIKGFTPHQKKVLAGCFIVYFCTYVGRLNMAPTLSSIQESFPGLDSARAGLLQTVFALTYAAGQLVFGYLADKFRPRRMIITGLVGSAASNLLFSFMPTFSLLVGMWTLNGAFQSMIWTPIVLCMTGTFNDTERKTASFVMSFTLAAGHLAAWALSLWLSKVLSWRWSYRVPFGVLCLAVVCALIMLPSGFLGRKQAKGSEKTSLPIGALAGTGLVVLLTGCVANGFVRDGVNTWAPTILGQSSDSLLPKLAIPCINMLGILLGGYLVRRLRTDVRMLTGQMMVAVALAALGAFLLRFSPAWALCLPLAVMSALLQGTNPLLTSLVPMQYDYSGRVGLVAGLVDSALYVGSALSGPVAGFVRDRMGNWGGVYVMWLAVALACFALAALSSKQMKTWSEKRMNGENNG